MACIATIDYFDKLMVVTLLPIALLAAVSFFVLLPLLIWDRRDFRDESSGRLQRSQWRNKAARLVLFSLFLICKPVSVVTSSSLSPRVGVFVQILACRRAFLACLCKRCLPPVSTLLHIACLLITAARKSTARAISSLVLSALCTWPFRPFLQTSTLNATLNAGIHTRPLLASWLLYTLWYVLACHRQSEALTHQSVGVHLQGIPLLSFVLLFKNRNNLQESSTRMRLGCVCSLGSPQTCHLRLLTLSLSQVSVRGLPNRLLVL